MTLTSNLQGHLVLSSVVCHVVCCVLFTVLKIMATSELIESTEIKKKFVKRCFAPGCGARSTINTEKLFFKLPDGVAIRREWALAVGRSGKDTVFHQSSGIYCCEDHFNLSEDSSNWSDVQRYGRRPRLKRGVLPRRVNKPNFTDSKGPDKLIPFEFVDICSFVDETESEQQTNIYSQ